MNGSALVSIIALAVSMLSLVWSAAWSMWLYSRSRRPDVMVETSYGLVPDAFGGTVYVLSTSVTNVGTLPVTVRGIVLKAKGDHERRQILPQEWMRAELPAKLGIGEHWDAPLLETAALVRMLEAELPTLARGEPPKWRLWTEARDAADNRYRSKRTVSLGR
jgi:hypothetical protein